MPIDNNNLVDLSPIFWGAGSDGVRMIQALLVTLAAGLLLALSVGTALYRRWSVDRLRACSDAEWVASEVLREGMSAAVSAPTPSGLASGTSLIYAVQKRWVTLTMPDSMGAVLPAGAPVAVAIYGEGCLYRFHATVLDRRTANGVPLLLVPKPPWVEKIQKREHCRVAVSLPTTFAVANTGSEENPPVRGVIDNVSGGGFRIAVPTAVPVGSVVRVRVPVATLMGYSFEARVVRCTLARDFGPFRHRVSCEFIHLPEETRNLIVSCCFEIQRELRAASKRSAA